MRHVIIQTFLACTMYIHNVPKYFKKLHNIFTNQHVFEGFFFGLRGVRAPFINEAILIRGYQGTSKPHNVT